MDINNLMFREYDIRGVYKEDINEEISYLIGKAYASNLIKRGKNKAIVGYDNRTSSPIIEKNIVKALTDSGVDVVRLGLVTTPMYYYAWDKLDIHAGIMITASHNPKEYNGFKFSYNGIHNACGQDVYDLYDTITKRDFVEGQGNIEEANIKEDYINYILRDIILGDKKVKVVYDCGNGTTCIVANDIFSKMNIERIPLFDNSDPEFPNHHPDPLVEENLKQLKETVLKEKADLGIAFDGDGDRVGVVDENGNMIDIDKYQIIIWRDIYNKVELKKGFFDVKCSKALEDELIKLGIEPIVNRTGNSYMKKTSYEGNFPFGGELSGHVFFRDRFNGNDDGIYAGIRLIEILSKTNKTVSELLDNISKYYSTKELKIHVDDEIKFNVINKVKEYCINKNYKILDIDGVKALFDDGSALVRASNTGPNITMRYEAKTESRLKEIEEEFTKLLDELVK